MLRRVTSLLLAAAGMLALPGPAASGPSAEARARYSLKYKEVTRVVGSGDGRFTMVLGVPVTRFKATVPLEPGADLPGSLDLDSVLVLDFSDPWTDFDGDNMEILRFDNADGHWSPGKRSIRWFWFPSLLVKARWSASSLKVAMTSLDGTLQDRIAGEGTTGPFAEEVRARVYLGDLDGEGEIDHLFSGTAAGRASHRTAWVGSYDYMYEEYLWTIRAASSMTGGPCGGDCPPIDIGGGYSY